jgi:FMN phosphatase YigB (HAD superfamily)
MLRAVIFDLDWCVVDNSTISTEVMQPVLEVVQHSRLPDRAKLQVIEALEANNLADIVEQFGLPREIANSMDQVYRRLEAPDSVRTFGDENFIRSILTHKVLVTTGYRRFQQGKIDKLCLTSLFDDIIIDALDDPVGRQGKAFIFKTLMTRNSWTAREVCVVGDNPLSELQAAKQLGMLTIQILRPTVAKAAGFDYYAHNFSEVAEICNRRRLV